MEEVLARGPNFVYGREFVREEHGPEAWQQVLEALPAPAAGIWAGTLLVTETYPFAAFKEMLAALTEVVGVRPEEETVRMYSYIADRSLNSIYKFFLSLTQPSFVIARYPILWQRFFKAGAVEVTGVGAGSARLHFTLPEIFLDWIRPACLGYSTKAVTLSGGRDLELEELEQTQLPDGQWRVSYQLSWRE